MKKMRSLQPRHLECKCSKLLKKVTEEQFQDICGAKVIYEEESDEREEEIQIEDLEQAPPKMLENRP